MRCLFVFALLAGTTLCANAQVAYVKIDGIPGPDSNDGDDGWIDLEGPEDRFVAHVMSRESGANHFGPFAIVKEIDETSIPIYLAMLKGTVITQVVLDLDNWTAWPGEMECTFKDVIITSVTQFVDEVPETLRLTVFEEIKFTFKRVEWKYSLPGEEKRVVVGGWDVQSDAEIPVPTGVSGFAAH